MKLSRPNAMAVVLFAAALLVSASAAAEFDCQRTNVCQRQEAANRAGARVQKSSTADTGKRARGFVPSKTAVRTRLAQAWVKAPAVHKARRGSKVPRCSTKPAVCARLRRR